MALKLVTGGAGYVGSHLARELLERGHQVRVFDVQDSRWRPREAEMMRADMREPEKVSKACEGVDTVFHLAFIQSLADMDEGVMREVNVGGTKNFLEAASREGVRRFVMTSTIEVYGTSPPFPCPEEAPKDPVGAYGAHKWICEGLCKEFADEAGLDSIILRMPNILGPGFYHYKPILDLLDRALEGRLLAVMGKGDIPGSVVSFEDVIAVYLLCDEVENGGCQAFNIAADQESALTQMEMVQAVISHLDSGSRVLKIPKPLARLALRLLDVVGKAPIPREQFGYLFHPNVYSVDKAKRVLGYAPTRTHSEAIIELVDGYEADREHIKAKKVKTDF